MALQTALADPLVVGRELEGPFGRHARPDAAAHFRQRCAPVGDASSLATTQAAWCEPELVGRSRILTAAVEVSAAASTLGGERLSVMPLAKALALGEARWEHLRSRTGWTSPFASWAWHHAWNASAPQEDREAAVVITISDDDQQLRAALPLAARQVTFRRAPATALMWAVGDVGCPDHLDVLATPRTALDGVVAALEAMEWDMLQLDGLVGDAAGARQLQAALEARGIATTLRPQWPCPYIQLPRSWDEYLQTRSPARRDVITRRERILARRGRMAVTFYGPDTLERGWSHLMRLHDARWRGEGAFDGQLDALHRQFAASLAPSGRTWLSTIDVDGEPISAWYGFADHDTLHFYQAGRSPAWNKFSVGAVHVGLMIQRAIALGLRRLDFLRGDEPYKAEWTSMQRWTYQLIGYRRSARGRMLRLAEQAGTIRDRFSRRDWLSNDSHRRP